MATHLPNVASPILIGRWYAEVRNKHEAQRLLGEMQQKAEKHAARLKPARRVLGVTSNAKTLVRMR